MKNTLGGYFKYKLFKYMLRCICQLPKVQPDICSLQYLSINKYSTAAICFAHNKQYAKQIVDSSDKRIFIWFQRRLLWCQNDAGAAGGEDFLWRRRTDETHAKEAYFKYDRNSLAIYPLSLHFTCPISTNWKPTFVGVRKKATFIIKTFLRALKLVPHDNGRHIILLSDWLSENYSQSESRGSISCGYSF